MNVLDEILDNHVDEDFDAEFIKSDHQSIKKYRPANHGSNNGTNNHNNKAKAAKLDHNNATGNGKKRTRSGDSSCSRYSSASRSRSTCSCGDRGSNKSRSRSIDRSQEAYRSPSLKIKITTTSDKRIVKDKTYNADLILNNRTLATREDDKFERKSRRLSSKKRDYHSLIKYFFKDSYFFLMKSNNPENVQISKSEGVWATPPQNEWKLNKAFQEYRNVILIFSVKESGRFQGFARLASMAEHGGEPVQWVLPPGLSSCPFGGVFRLDWICKNELSFNHTSHLYNPFNDNRPVKIARDGQEIEPQVGEELCRLFPADDDSDLIPMLKRMKKQTAHRPKKVVRNPEPEYDKFVETRHVSSHQVSSRRHHSSDYYEDRANYSHRHLRDERSDRNRLYGRSSRRDGHGSVHAHANYYHQQHHHHHHSRRSPYQADPYYDAGRRGHSRYDRRY